MLLKKNSNPQIDYLENWPSHYYDIPTASLRKELLQEAINQNLDPEHDPYRMELLNRRFFSKGKKETGDAFMLAWIMIKSAASAGGTLKVKKLQRELEGYLETLCLRNYTPKSPAQQQVLEEEWEDLAKRYILSCTKSKNYCSTFFSIVPLKDDAVAKKLADEINLVTQVYPARFGLEEAFFPLRIIFISAYNLLVEYDAF